MAYTTIDNPELYFQTKIYTGDGSATQAQTFDGSEDMQPDWVWIKSRSNAEAHSLTDSVRGVTKWLESNSTAAEQTNANTMKAFGTDGFSVGLAGSVGDTGQTYVAWCWKESATAGFDIVGFTGNATARNISHNLSAIPELIIIKNYSSSSSYWTSYHKPLGNTAELYLNSTDAAGGSVASWNSTTPDSSNFRLGANTGVNGSGNSIIAYVFAPKQGFSKFGSYTGNGNNNGPFVYTGFKPAFLLIKNATGNTEQWNIWDNKRQAYKNPNITILQPSRTTADNTGGDQAVDFLSNGFKVRYNSTEHNQSGETMVYMAFAEAPFVNSNGVPCNAR